MTLHQHIKARLRAAGLTRQQVRAIIETTKTQPLTRAVNGHWNSDVEALPPPLDQADLATITRQAIAIGMLWVRQFDGGNLGALEKLEATNAVTRAYEAAAKDPS